MKYIFLLLISIIANCSHAEHCENYDRKYFTYFLPKNFPDQINCLDSIGRKQGAWIDYNILYNAVKKTDELDTGYYVPEYSFEYYKDNRKIDKWKHVYNVHSIALDKITDYYYAADTILMTVSDHMEVFQSSLYVNNDSSKWVITETGKKYPIEIICNKADVCMLKYRGEILNFFTKSKYVDCYIAFVQRSLIGSQNS